MTLSVNELKPSGKCVALTLKPSAAPLRNHNSISSATFSGVPAIKRLRPCELSRISRSVAPGRRSIICQVDSEIPVETAGVKSA